LSDMLYCVRWYHSWVFTVISFIGLALVMHTAAQRSSPLLLCVCGHTSCWTCRQCNCIILIR